MKIESAQLKNLFQKLELLKNYSAYVLPTILLIVALILFVPARVMSARLKTKITKQSLSNARQIESLLSDNISLEQWKVERQYQDAYAKDANEMLKLLRQTTMRELLSYDVFPEPNETSILIFHNFGRSFRSHIEQLIHDLKGKDRPSDIEISNSLQQSSAALGRDTQTRFIGRKRLLDISGSGFALDQLNDLERMIVNELCLSTAKSASFYINPLDLPGYTYWDVDSTVSAEPTERYRYQSIEQSVEACWYWQIGYWIIEDVLKTIGQMNNNCQNVLDCPVKRLLSLSFAPEEQAALGSTGESSKEMPFYVLSPSDGLVRPHTGRVSNDKIDVVHFRFSVLVDADEALNFMEQLCKSKEHIFRGWKGDEPPRRFKHNQITILESKIEAIDFESPEHQLYRYGDDAVVKLELTCEYIFDTIAYEPIKPEFIKNLAASSDEKR